MKTCAACNKPIQPGDFYVEAIRVEETVAGVEFASRGYPVHVPSCPPRYTPEEWAEIFPPKVYEMFGANPPVQPENQKL